MDDAALRVQFAARAVEARERFSMERIAGMWEELFAASYGSDRRGDLPGRTDREELSMAQKSEIEEQLRLESESLPSCWKRTRTRARRWLPFTRLRRLLMYQARVGEISIVGRKPT